VGERRKKPKNQGGRARRTRREFPARVVGDKGATGKQRAPEKRKKKKKRKTELVTL